MAALKQQVAKWYDFGDWQPEPMIGDFINRFDQGGELHSHMDPSNTPHYDVVRFNVMLRRPEAGGEFLVNSYGWHVIGNINEGDGLLFPAGRFMHRSNPIDSKRQRFILSLGYLVSSRVADRLEAGFREFVSAYPLLS